MTLSPELSKQRLLLQKAYCLHGKKYNTKEVLKVKYPN